jgi:hypothetical protein
VIFTITVKGEDAANPANLQNKDALNQQLAETYKTETITAAFAKKFNEDVQAEYSKSSLTPVYMPTGKLAACHSFGPLACLATIGIVPAVEETQVVVSRPSGGQVLAVAPPFMSQFPPFSDPFLGGGGDGFGEPPIGVMPELPPMEPLPPPPPEPEEPPPLPEDIEPPVGSGECAGGNLLGDLGLYSSCTHIDGWLGITNLPTILDLDPLLNLNYVGGDIIISGNNQLSNVDGLSNLEGDLPGMLKMSNNPMLSNADGIAGITGLGKNTISGESLVLTDLPDLRTVPFSSMCSAPGAVQIRNTPLLNDASLDCLTNIGADSNGHSLILQGTGIYDMNGFSSVLSLEGGALISDNMQFASLAGLENLGSVGSDNFGVSMGFDNNPFLDNMDALKNLNGELQGSLQLNANGVTQLDGLKGITRLGADTNGTSILATNNGNLKDLCGLQDVEKVGGSVHANNNPSMETLCLNSLAEVGADKLGVAVSLIADPFMTNIELPSLVGDLPGSALIDNIGSTNLDLFKGITSVAGDVKQVAIAVKSSPVTNFDGLSDLEDAKGALAFADLGAATDINLPKIKSVGGSNSETGNADTTSTGNALEFVSMGNLGKVSMQSLTEVGGGIQLTDNPKLTVVEMEGVDRYKCNAKGFSFEFTDMGAFQGISTGKTPTALDCAAQYANLYSFRNFDSQQSVNSVGKSTTGQSISIKDLPNLEDDSGFSNVEVLPGSLSVQGTVKLSTLGLAVKSIGADAAGRCVEIVDVKGMKDIGLRQLVNCEGGVAIVKAPETQHLGMDIMESVKKDSSGRSYVIIDTSIVYLELKSKMTGSVELGADTSLQGVTIGTDYIGADTDGTSFKMTGTPLVTSVVSTTPFVMAGGLDLSNSSALETFAATVSSIGKATNGVSVSVQNMSSFKSASGLANVTTLPGSIVMKNNPVMELLIGFDSMTEVGKDISGNSLELAHNAMLQTMNGMRTCNSMEGALVLMWNPMLSTLEGLQNVTRISGKNAIGDSILLMANPKLKDLHGLAGLSGSIPGAVSLEMMDSLESVQGLSGVKSIASPNIYGNALELISLPKLTTTQGLGIEGVVPGAVVVEKTGLTNVDGMEGITGAEGKNLMDVSVLIHDNKALANLDGLCNFGGTLPGAVDVTANPLLQSVDPLVKCKKPIVAAEGVVVSQIKCLTGDEVKDLKSLCHGATCVQRIQDETPRCLETAATKNILVGAGTGRTCGGASGAQWQEWKHAGSSGLFIDVDTTKCNFKMTPAYVTSMSGDSAHWQLVGVNSIMNATATGFRVFVWHPTLRGEFMKFFAKRYNWRMTWMANTGRTSGITKPGITGWKRFAKDTIYVDVNTTACNYPTTPSYVTAIHGSADHWRTQGVHSIYYPQKDGFRVYVMHAASEGITPAEAERKSWSIAWVGSNDPKTAGTSSDDWKMYCASNDDECAATAHYYSLFIDVDTSANKFVTTPAYVSSVAGKAHHLVATGGSSIFRASLSGFRVYLDHAPTPLVAKAANWHVNYIGFEEPIDCSFAPWGSWSTCDKSCGGGKSTRERDTITKNNHSGKCGNAVEVQKCAENACAVDCSVSAWNEWSVCTKTCGEGVQTRSRSVKVNASGGGMPCGALDAQRPCTKNPCAIDCVMTQWSTFSECSKSCGTGNKQRTRSIDPQHVHNPITSPCPKKTDILECNAAPCPIDCIPMPWGSWTTCDNANKCGTGQQTRTRAIASYPVFGGKACESTEASRTCSLGACAVECKVSPWQPDMTGGPPDWNYEDGSWSACSKTCGVGIRKRIRSVITEATGHHVCPDLTEETECKVKDCPVDCAMTNWGMWTPCTRTCGVGIQQRMRSESVSAAFGGTPCGLLSQHQLCNQHNCPTDCDITTWSTWGACNIDCVDRSKPSPTLGERKRSRMIITSEADGGKACPSLVGKIECDPGPCPIHCEVSKWFADGKHDEAFDDGSQLPGATSWSTCSNTCGKGVRKRKRFEVQHSEFGGFTCPTLTDDLECELKPCAIDCAVSQWSSWDTFINGGSELRRTRIINTAAQHGGATCPSLVQTKDFHNECVEHNEVGAWSQCSHTCGLGYKYRYYIHHKCSKQAAVKMLFKLREGIHCVMPACINSAAHHSAERQITVPDITHPPTQAPMNEVRLSEELGQWRDVSEAERQEFALPVGAHMQLQTRN